MTSSPSGSANAPARIHADRPAQRLEIEWRDGHKSVYEFEPLRWLCPCATCRGEGGMPGWLDSNPTLTASQTTLIDLRLVGSYAVQPTWGDGHATGYYSFASLRDQCPCAECAGRRAAAGQDAAEPRAGAGAHQSHAAGEDAR